MQTFIVVLDVIVKYGLPIFATFISWRAFANSKKLEQEKSKLRKNEIIFKTYSEAVFKFNQFYQKLLYEIIDKNLSSQEDLNYNFCNKSNLMRSFLAEFMGLYAPVLGKDINENLSSLKKELNNMAREEDKFSKKYARPTEDGYEIDGIYIQFWVETTEVSEYVKNILDKFNHINQELQTLLKKYYSK